MMRLPLWLSIVAVALAVAALAIAILLPGPRGPMGPQGPKGDTGEQGIQGSPSALLVNRQVVWLRAGQSGQASTTCSIDLGAGDVLQGYVSSTEHYFDSSSQVQYFDYRIDISVHLDPPHVLQANLGSGRGAATFSYVAEVTGRHSLHVWYADLSPVLDWHPSGFEEHVPVVYWIQQGAEQQ